MDWTEYYMGMAERASLKSKDPNTKVGAVLADRHNGLIAATFNGFPIGVDDSLMADREKKLPRVIHAEVNAFIFADKHRLAGATLYVTKAPCAPCAAVICQHHALFGPISVVAPPLEAGSNWTASQHEGLQLFKEAKVEVRFIQKEAPGCPHKGAFDFTKSVMDERISIKCKDCGEVRSTKLRRFEHPQSLAQLFHGALTK